MTDEQIKVLSDIRDGTTDAPFPGNPGDKFPWTGFGTRANEFCERWRNHYVDWIGESATGNYWKITNAGREELYKQQTKEPT